jgi:hypothetical protein
MCILALSRQVYPNGKPVKSEMMPVFKSLAMKHKLFDGQAQGKYGAHWDPSTYPLPAVSQCRQTRRQTDQYVAVLWEVVLNLFKIGKTSLLGSGRPRGLRGPFQMVGDFAPAPFARVSGAPGATETPKMTDLRV